MKTPSHSTKVVAAFAAMTLFAASCGADSSSSSATDDDTTNSEVAAAENESTSAGDAESDTNPPSDSELETDPELETDSEAGSELESGSEDDSVAQGESGDAATAVTGTLAESEFYGEYEIVSEEFGTNVQVTLTDDMRVVSSNALPPWDAGEFPEGNNTELSEQDNEYLIPLVPVYDGQSTRARTTGVSIAGIKFDAGTAQEASCENGVRYNIEAVQDLIPFGLDENNAHVQNDGTYHYHDKPVSELEGDEPELVGFAFDGHMIYYSPNGEYESSFQLRTEDREGENCTYSEPDLAEISFDSTPDGTFAQDWEFIEGSGDLDACNGIEVNGEYAYFITDEYPLVPRCLNGVVEGGDGGGGGGGGGPEGGGGRPEGGGGGRPEGGGGGPEGGGGGPEDGGPEGGEPPSDG